MNFINNLIRMMYGRYGIDDLHKFSFYIFIILLITNVFVKSYTIAIIEILLFIIMLYRLLSKNIYKRNKENKIYLSFKRKLLMPFKNIKRNFKERKVNVYKHCHHCHTTLKLPLPNTKGIKHVICPDCKKRNTFLILRKVKIEIIKQKIRGKI